MVENEAKNKRRELFSSLPLCKNGCCSEMTLTEHFQVYKEASHLRSFHGSMRFLFSADPFFCVPFLFLNVYFLIIKLFFLLASRCSLSQVPLRGSHWEWNGKIPNLISGDLSWSPDSVHLVADKRGGGIHLSECSPLQNGHSILPPSQGCWEIQVNTKDKAW